ncbi:MAG TPA: radical SAM family heme chaperone HemW [Steroidobacteraceae bacterium]|nr:radical SAM family heme chaperone HemW [Steroidobacteraceae bacterium]
MSGTAPALPAAGIAARPAPAAQAADLPARAAQPDAAAGTVRPLPLALYVHFPWCVRKCPYCDFNSYSLHGELPQEAYLAALERDLAAQAAHVKRAQAADAKQAAQVAQERQAEPGAPGRPAAPAGAEHGLISVFLGGGTPSLFPPEAIGRVLAAARAAFGFAPGIEITLEANPGTIERGRFAEYAAAGVNRVSLGAQSFAQRQLAALGRIHSGAETVRAAEELHAAGLSNFNLDLMYGLPAQDRAGALADLRQGLALAPSHLSHYQLTLEPGTPFAAKPPALPSEEECAAMLAACEAALSGAGFGQYEVSAWARPGHRSRHNLNYWTFGDYVGAGAGAHGKLTRPGGIVRTSQTRDPRRYQAGVPMTTAPVGAADLPFEFMMNALRLPEGFEEGLYRAHTGLNWSTVADRMGTLTRRGLVAGDGGRWRPTPMGLRYLNDVLVSFLPQDVTSRTQPGKSLSSPLGV